MESRPHVDPSVFNATTLYSVGSVHPLHLLLSTSLSSSSFLSKQRRQENESQIFSEDSGQEQLISNVGRLNKPAFAERDKKQTMIDLRGISSNWFY
jgi:hypothetical protein